MEISNIQNHIAFCEAQGLAKCFQAYANNCAGDDIAEIGFNPNSGYTYIALEHGVSICSMLGRHVEYLVTNYDDGTEYLFDDYNEAMKFNPYETTEKEHE